MRNVWLALIIILSLFSIPAATTQAWASSMSIVTWARTYTATATEGFVGSSMQQTADGGFIVAGSTVSSQIIGQTWLLRLDATGGVLWQKAYGSFSPATPIEPMGPQVRLTPDGGFVVSSATNVSVHTFAGWVFKVDTKGNLLWQRAFTGIGNVTAFSMDNAVGGGFLLAGSTFAAAGSLDALIVKLSDSGSVEWQKTFAGLGNAVVFSIYHTADGGAVVVGSTEVSTFARINAWLLRVDALGNIVWQKTYPEALDLFSVQQTSDGGFVSTGIEAIGGTLLVMRSDSEGITIWQKIYGGSIRAQAHSVRQTTDGGFILAGSSGTRAVPLTPNMLVVRLDPLGTIMWQRNFVTISISDAFSASQTSDHGFVVVGFAFSNAPPPPSFGSEAVVLKLGAGGLVQGCTLLSNASLVSSGISLTSTNVAGGGVDISVAPVTTTSASMETSAEAPFLCRHGFGA